MKEITVERKRHRLTIQVGIITILTLVAMLVFFLFFDYTITRNTYLSSKNEMIDRDLVNVRVYIKDIRLLPWALKFWRENEESVTRRMTEAELALEGDRTYQDELSDCLGGELDPEELEPVKQLLVARHVLSMIAVTLKNNDLNYAGIYLLGILDEHTSCIYTDEQSYDGYSEMVNTVSYETKDHSAVKQILSDGITDMDQTFYEIYHDPADEKAYYIGYIPVTTKDGEKCMLCIRYDWSVFYRELLSDVMRSMIVGILVLLLLNGLLMLLIYRKAISPVIKVKKSIQDYKVHKDCTEVSEQMNRIRVKNEVGVLADNFSQLTMEIDRYTKEIQSLSSEKARISTELELATRIQSSMLPGTFPAFPDRKDFDIYASMDPAKEVGGDFYDFFLVDDDHLCMMIADVSGKGVPAALFMMSSMIILRSHAMQGKSPSVILRDTNAAICEHNEEDMFVTVWLGILELSTGRLTAANAGHEYPVIQNGSGTFELYKDKHGMIVGGMDGVKYREYEVNLEPGTRFFVYTDGVPEAKDANDEMYGTERMVAALNERPNASPEEILIHVRESVDAFVKGAEQFDDLTMLCLFYRGAH